jgi:hypothetical protein
MSVPTSHVFPRDQNGGILPCKGCGKTLSEIESCAEYEKHKNMTFQGPSQQKNTN